MHPNNFFRQSLVLLLLAFASHGAGLQWTDLRQGRSAALSVPRQGKPGFTLLSPNETGVRFTNSLSDAKAAENQIRLLGSGIALGDVDGDGRCDIYACSLTRGNALYRNLGDWKFEDITASAGVACAGQYSTGAVLADVDGDGDLDLLVNSIGGGTRLFLNDGKAKFTEAANSGLEKRFCATSLALADVDGDGDLDLYVANYRTTTIRSTGLSVLNVNGKRMVRPEDRDQYEFTPEGLLLEHGEPDFLYLNDGKGHFTAVPWIGGAFVDEDGMTLAAPQRDWGLSVMMRDVNGDGAPDIYICNDFWSPDRIWINDGSGRFRALPRLAMRNSSTFSMGVDFADINRDGQDDFIVVDMLSRDHARRMRQRAMTGQNFNKNEKIDDRPQVERNTLYLNRGDGSYAEIAQLAGVAASEWSWGIAFIDIDLDGWEDVLITNGHDFDTQDSDTEQRLAAMGPIPSGKLGAKLLQFPRLNVANVAFRNRGDLTFEEVSAQWGFDAVGVSHGIALADLDNDGDQDVVINNLNGALGIYRNNASAPRIAIRLKGKSPNTQGIGAKIKVTGVANSVEPPTQTQEIISGGRYLSGDDPMRVFAAGNTTNRLSIEVTWRDGSVSRITDAQANHIYEIGQAQAERIQNPLPARKEPFFRDVSDLLQHTHDDEAFDDFARQPTLPRKLSHAGPGVAWFDVDGDGIDELVIGGGRGGRLTIFENKGRGRFKRSPLLEKLGRNTDEQTSIIGWHADKTGATMLVAQSNYESANTNASVQRFEISNGSVQSHGPLLLPGASIGPVAVADVDGDGALDVFIGGRVAAGRYPEPVGSRLYRNKGAEFELAADWPKLGLVTGAVFSDLDNDGFPELILASDAGPVRVFRNDRGRLTPWVPAVVTPDGQHRTLNDLTGWWNAVATGDFDGDGRLDIVAANWGRNTPYQSYVRDGLRLYYGDLADSGGVEIVEAYVDGERRHVVPWRDLQTLTGVIPSIRERFATAAAYGQADLEQILGPTFKRASQVVMNWPDTTLFLNRGDHFEARPLPLEAQFAPAFGLCVVDYDGDGHEDIFLAQNFFGVASETSRYDAGRGLWLRGDGHGGFSAVPADESGVRIYGEQRGAAICDYDVDGRIDLVVGQNAAATKLYHNERAQPGVRVRLKGPPGNPSAFGAMVRIMTAGQGGPAREIQGGSGYLSQNSAVQVLAVPSAGAKILVRWPGGRETRSDIPPQAKEIAIDISGTLTVVR
jgi:hypothetical protein